MWIERLCHANLSLELLVYFGINFWNLSFSLFLESDGGDISLLLVMHTLNSYVGR